MMPSEPLSLRGALVRSVVFFLYLALPALLVIQDVRYAGAIFWMGILWGLSIGLLSVFALSLACSRRLVRWVVCAIVGIFAFLNTALALSFIIQGTSFNTAFFSHLDMSTLKIAMRTDGLRMLLGFLYILAAPIVTYWATARTSKPDLGLTRMPALIKVAVAGLMVWTSYPITAIYQHHITTTQTSARLVAEIDKLRVHQASQITLPGKEPRNLVLIYLESLEGNYLDPELFPGLTPNLDALALEAQWFRNIHQFPGTSWTIGGIVSSVCGVPLLSERNGNMILTDIDNPFVHITCLAEYLQEAGYKTAYIGGASLDFAGKRNFLRDNGYDVMLGIDELPDSSAHKWGSYDDAMYAHASDLFDGLAESGDPFLFTTLTLDTHHPRGTPSPSCAPYQGSTSIMLSAVHCADQLVGDFVAHIRASPVGKGTVIAIMSDHLVIYGATEEKLKTKDRRVLFMVLDPDRPARQMFGAAAHFDVAPTLLDALGFSDTEFAFGQSLLSHDLGRAFERNLSEGDFEAFKIERLTEAKSN